MDFILEAQDLLKIYRSSWTRQKTTALDHLSLKVERGQIFGLLGPNGSGKTTALKAFLGMIRLNHGEVKLMGESPHQMSVKSKIGFLPEESYLYKFLSAQESLEFFGRLAKLDSKTLPHKIDTVLEKVGLLESRKRLVKHFSKGMLRRLGLAFILLKDPELIFLDEPTVGLDPIGAFKIRQMMIDLKTQGKTIVMCSHLLGEIENVCDKVAILYQGKVLKEDTLEKILSIPEKIQIILQNQSQNMGSLQKLLKDSHIEIESIGNPRKSLEKAFMEIIHLSS
ncbi:MAG: ABC transporter ATP-binding protein [Chlamydiae bacterium]|nr:ABC transporter ATP-binding protein [Chlamydiota bacterium]MBI3267166.1 ABC transporter ATP-binding protein [Chlamydiota bacterium]